MRWFTKGHPEASSFCPLNRAVSLLGQHLLGDSEHAGLVIGVDPFQVKSCKIDKLGDLRYYAAVPGTECSWAELIRNKKRRFHGV